MNPNGSIFERLKTYVLKFNIFLTHTPSDDDPHQRKIQLYSTRLFFSILLISLIILLSYNIQLQYNDTVTLTNPSLTTYLELEPKYGDALSCPCTNIAIERRHFLTITPIFHQVCHSDFVGDAWLNYLRSAATLYVSADFRFTGSILFTILASFCRSANQTITESLPDFYSTRYVSSKVINSKQFDEEVQSMIDLYISTTSNAFAQSFELIRDMTYTDGLLSGLKTNFQYSRLFFSSDWSTYIPLLSYERYGACSCEATPSCVTPAKISNFYTVPGLYIGCYLMEAMRQSNLLCLYNQTCLDQISLHLQAPNNFTARPMVASNASRFTRFSKVSDLLAEMMVEAWSENLSYNSYFEQCQSSSCVYTVFQRHDVIYIATSVLGIFGGLFKVLVVMVPLITSWLMNYHWRRQVTPENRVVTVISSQHPSTFRNKVSAHLWQVWSSVRSVNLFPSYPVSVDPYELKTERLSGLIFVLSMVISILVLISYTASQVVIKTILIPSPSLTQYQQLYAEHSPDSLSCPCSTIAVEYGGMINLAPIYHEYCSSDFVAELWLSYWNSANVPLVAVDLRQSISLVFNSLASYCSISKRTVANEIRLFQSTSMVSPILFSPSIFHDRTNEVVSRFFQSVAVAFVQNLEFLRTNTYGNQLLTGLMTNAFITFDPPTSTNGEYVLATRTFNIFEQCFCEMSPRCSTAAVFYSFNGTSINDDYYVPGLRIGCYNNEALRQSTFECFYDQYCVTQLKNYLNFNQTSIRVLNSSRMTYFNITTKLQTIIENLMVDQWIWNDSFSNYYQICQPIHCSYKVFMKTPLIIIMTTLLGLLGGLMKIFKIIIPIIVRIFRRRQTENVDFRPLYIQYKEKIIHLLRTLNLFRTRTPLDDHADQTRIQIVSTGVFIIVFILSIIILISYTSQSAVTQTVSINSPSYIAYLSFYERHGDQALCSCSNIVSSQGHWISIDVRLHPICSSDFIGSSWFDMLYSTYFYTDAIIYNRDFRFRSPYYFQSLASFCQLSNLTLIKALKNFKSNSFISTRLLHRPSFTAQNNATINSFYTSMVNTFVRSLKLLRETNYGNTLVANTLSSFSFSFATNGTLDTTNHATWDVNFRYKSYNSSQCSCRDTPKCIEQARVFTFNTYIPLFSIPGIYIGCYTFEALLQSNLHYFYNQTNLESLVTQLSVNQSNNQFRAINIEALYDYPQNEPIERILERMMINRWTQNVSFENYFNQCRPMECRYFYLQKFDVLYIITSITALIGGLTSGLQLIVPRLVRLTRFHRCFSH